MVNVQFLQYGQWLRLLLRGELGQWTRGGRSLHINVQVNLEESPESHESRSSFARSATSAISCWRIVPRLGAARRRDQFYGFLYRSWCAWPETLVSNNSTEKEWRRVDGGGAIALSKLHCVPHLVQWYSMGSSILAGSSRAVVRTNDSLCRGLRAANKSQLTYLPSVVREIVGGGEEGAVAADGGVGRLPRIRVSRSALSVVGGLLALGGLYIVLCPSLLLLLLWNCKTNENIFGFFAVFL